MLSLFYLSCLDTLGGNRLAVSSSRSSGVNGGSDQIQTLECATINSQLKFHLKVRFSFNYELARMRAFEHLAVGFKKVVTAGLEGDKTTELFSGCC